MAGSTFIFTTDPERLLSIADEGVDAVDDFAHVSMESLLSLDFVSACTLADIDWNDGEPIVVDESSGLAVYKVAPLALQHVLSAASFGAPEQAADIETLRTFVARHGTSCIYELATF